jgi:cytidine kinase
MSLLVTGSIGIDTVRTPHGEAQEVLGGSAVYFSFAASLFSPVALVGVVGEDFPQAFHDVLANRGIDLGGLEKRAGSKTFRWTGSYEGSMNEAQTLNVELNVLAEAGPRIPDHLKDSRFVFLANTHPALQRDLLSQLNPPHLVMCDTMNLWIKTEREELIRTLGVVNGIVLNDGEARMLTGQTNLVTAGRKILDWGPTFVVIKKGEHGSMLVLPKEVFVLPAYPTTDVVDPTGAGDSFAGGMMGYLASKGTFNPAVLKQALARGTIAASLTIEGFSLNRLGTATKDEVERRLQAFALMMRFD